MKMLLAVAIALAGCSKSQPPAAPKAAPAALPTAPVVAPPVTPRAPEPEPPKPTPAPTVAAPEPDMPKAVRPQPTRAPSTVCTRACNKAQRCATSGGSVAVCVDTCLTALSATDPEGQRDALAFRAQERCADGPCESFGTCVSEAIVGESAAAKAPPMAPEDAKKVCKTLCDKEKECKPDVAARRVGGMSTCLGTCANLLVSTEADASVQRVMMNAAYACHDKSCEDFDPCVHENLVPTPPASAK